MASILRYTKEVYRTFKEVNGNYKLDTSSAIGRMNLGNESFRFLASYLDFVMNAGVIGKATKIYIEAVENNLMDAIHAYNQGKSELEQIKDRQAWNQVGYDTRKLLTFFPDDMITNIIYKRGYLEIYEAMLQSAINKKLKKSVIQDMSALKIPMVFEKTRPTEAEFDRFFQLYAPYTKETIKMIEEQLPRNVVGYYNYITSKGTLTEDEKIALERLKNVNSVVVE